MKFTSLLSRSICLNLVLGSGLTGVFAVSAADAWAQQRGPQQRVVQGKVTDKADAAMSGAVVYLKDDHSLSVKSFITSNDGTYRFGQLSQNTDYEVWAESDNRKSPVKSVSSFDTKNLFTINLKIDK